MIERDLRTPTDETMDWLVSLPTSKLVKVLMDAGRISHRPEDISMLAQLIERIRRGPPPEAVVLLREAYDSGYLKTKITYNETELEERVIACLGRHRTGSQPEAGSTIPAGWKLVPIEPTDEMKRAGANTGCFIMSDEDTREWIWQDNAETVWGAMIAASAEPQLPQGEKP